MAIVACSIASVCVLTFYHPNTNSITTNINSATKVEVRNNEYGIFKGTIGSGIEELTISGNTTGIYNSVIN